MNIKAIEIIHSANVVDNLQAFKESIPDIEKFIATTGIQRRYVAPQAHKIEDYFVKGIANMQLDYSSIDAIITVTQTPSKLIPSLSNYILSKIPFNESILTFDLITGCSGYTEALVLANLLFQTANCQQIVICNGDFSTHVIAENNFTIQPLFSDIAAVTLLEKSDNHFFASNIKSYPKGYSAINSENGKMNLNGLEVFQFSTLYTADAINELLSENNIQLEDIQQFYFHQANLIINKTIMRQLKLDESKVPSSIEEFGNSSSASIPVTLCLANKKTEEKQRILLSGFGVGFKICNVVLETTGFSTNISAFEDNEI